MDHREVTSPAALKLFGREPTTDDWRFVGRWAFGAAWLATDRITARDLVRSRLEGAAHAAMAAAVVAGPGEASRFSLVSALARIPEAIRGEGAYAEAVERAIDEAASALYQEGKELRELAADERETHAPRFYLDGFDAAMHETGPDRHVLLREVALQLDEAVSVARGVCLSLRALRLFLQSTLSMDSHETPTVFESGVEDYGESIVRMGLWLMADLAMSAQRAARYEKAWVSAAKVCGDPLSRLLAGLSSGSAGTEVSSAIYQDPMTLVIGLAMTSEPEHAAALLGCGVQAQKDWRSKAAREIARWTAQASRIGELEHRLGLAVVTSYEYREGFRDCPSIGNADLLQAWHWGTVAGEATRALADAVDRSIRLELERRRARVRAARANLEAVRAAQEAQVDRARQALFERIRRDQETHGVVDNTSLHWGCMYGFSAGCGVMGIYALVGVVIGVEGMIGRIAPIVAGIAALPVMAAIVAQVAMSLKRAAATAEAVRRREAADEEFEKAKELAEKQASVVLEERRHSLEEAEADLAEFERQVAPEMRGAA